MVLFISCCLDLFCFYYSTILTATISHYFLQSYAEINRTVEELSIEMFHVFIFPLQSSNTSYVAKFCFFYNSKIWIYQTFNLMSIRKQMLNYHNFTRIKSSDFHSSHVINTYCRRTNTVLLVQECKWIYTANLHLEKLNNSV